jgi:hypothetical protein
VSERPRKVRDDTDRRWQKLTAEAGRPSARAKPVTAQLANERKLQAKIDRRTLRKTGRTEQFNVRLRRSSIDDILAIADQYGWLNAVVIEKAIAALKAELAEAS